jgi:hypothetical protein
MACRVDVFSKYFTDYICYESERDKSELGTTTGITSHQCSTCGINKTLR